MTQYRSDRPGSWLLAGAIALLAGFGMAFADEAPSIKQQIKELNNVTGEDALLAKTRDILKDRAKAKALVTEAVKLLKEKEPPFNFNTAQMLGRTAVVIKEYAAAEQLYRYCREQAEKLQSLQKVVDVYEDMISLLQRQKKYDEAVKLCEEFLDLESTEEDSPLANARVVVLLEMANAMARDGRIDDAIKRLDAILGNGKNNWFILRVKGLVYIAGEKLEEGADLLNESIELLKKAKGKGLSDGEKAKIVKEMRYRLSEVYVDMNQVKKGAEQLEMLLKDDPSNAMFNNNLGYILAEHDMRIDDAEKFIRRALEEERKVRKELGDKLPKELDHDSASYLDSLGWVLYKKKDYAGAKKALQEAMKYEEGRHIEILDHLADVHMASGEPAEAIKVWEESLKLEIDGKREEKRKKSVEEKLAKAKAMPKK